MPPGHRRIRPQGSLAIVVATALLATTPVAGLPQSADDRLALDAMRDTLESVGDSQSLDSAAEWRGNSTVRLVREGLILLRRGEIGDSREPYDEALRHIERALDADPDWPYPWYALGLIRLAMSTRGFVVKATPYHGQGISYRRAAMDGFARAIKADSSFLPACDALASLIVAMGHRLLPQEFVAPLRRASGVSGASAAVPLALFRLEYVGGRYGDATLELLDEYLRRGGDSGVARLEQSRVLQAAGRGAEAPAAYTEGLRAMGVAGRNEYRADLAWVAADWELAEYDSLPASQLAEWITRFWQERDALALRTPGERLAEHLRRWVFVHQRYLIHRPDDAPIHAEGLTRFEQENSGENFGVINAMVLNDLNYTTPNFKVYQRMQWEIDDRGVIYLRHGPPGRTAIYPAGPPNESWQYDLPEGSRVFHFLGSRALGTTAATTLVAALPLQPEMLDSRGNLDSRYTAIASDLQRKIAQMRGAVLSPNSGIDTTGLWDQRPGSAAAAVNVASRFVAKGPGRVLPPPVTFHPEIAYREIERGRSAIAVGVTTDGFPQHFKQDLDAVVQVYGVGFGDGETRRVLTVFAVPGRGLTPRPRSDGGPGMLYPVTLRIIAMDREHGVIRQLDTTRTFLTRDTLKGEQHLTGFLELAVPPGRYQVRTMVTVPGLDATTGAGRDSVEVPPSPRDLVLSDLILGRQESGLSWSYGGTRVPLNPLDTYQRGSDADLFYEIGGLLPGTAYQITMAVRKPGDKPDAKPAVEAGFDFRATAPYELVTRGLGLSNLKPGGYRLQVRVREAGSDRQVTRSRSLNILR